MLQYRPLQFALLISLGIHAVFLTVFSIFHLRNIPAIPRQIEVTYSTPKQKKLPPIVPSPSKEVTTFKKNESSHDLDILSKNDSQASRLKDEFHGVDKSRNVIPLGRKQAPSIRTFQDSNRIITVPLLKSEKITNPKYLSYTEAIRQKILNTARRLFEGNDRGKVKIAFILDNKGYLRDVKIINEKTNASEYLRQLSIRSLKESSPFESIPKDLNYQELPFNIDIEFNLKR